MASQYKLSNWLTRRSDHHVSPQSIAVAAAAGDLIGKESDLFRFTVKHSFIMLLLICFIVLGQAYLFNWVVPKYQMLVANTTQIIPNFTKGYAYLGVFAFVVAAFGATILLLNRKYD